MAVLGPLEDDPEGQVMSRAGALGFIHEIVREYMSYRAQTEASARPGAVRRELIEIAEKAAALKKALAGASGLARLAILKVCGSMQEVPQDLGRLALFDSADGDDLPSPGVGGERDDSAQWFAKLTGLELLHRTTAEDSRFNDGGGGQLRAQGRWLGTPNHWLVRQCRALLEACGRPCGGGKDGPLVLLLSALRELTIGPGSEAAFNNDIREVLAAAHSDLNHQAATTLFVLRDLRRRKPAGDAATQEAERVYAEILGKLDEALGIDVDLG